MKDMHHSAKSSPKFQPSHRSSLKEYSFRSGSQKEYILNTDYFSISSTMPQDKKDQILSSLNQDLTSGFDLFSKFNKLKASEQTSPVCLPDLQKTENLYKLDKKTQSNIEHLDKWLKTMKYAHVPEIDAIIRKNLIPRSEITKKVEEIYCTVLNEIIKQVAGSNRLRAELLENVVGTLRYVWIKYPQHLNFLLEKEKEYCEEKCMEIELKYKEKIEKYKQRLRVSTARVKRLEDDKEMLEKEIVILNKSGLDYKEEISNFVRNSRKEWSNASIQVDFGVEVWPEATQKKGLRIIRSNTIFERSNNLEKLKKLRDNIQDAEYLEEQKKKLINDMRNIIGLKEKVIKMNLDSIASKVTEQCKSLADWVNGFKFGFELIKASKKQIIKSPTNVTTPKFSFARQSLKNKVEKKEPVAEKVIISLN